MDSSDEELFDAVPNTSTPSVNTTTASDDANSKVKVRDCSVHLTRISVNPKNRSVISSRKRKYTWKYGNSNRKKSKKKIGEAFGKDIESYSNHETAAEVESTVGTVSSENYVDDCSDIQHEGREKLHIHPQQNSKDQDMRELSSSPQDMHESFDSSSSARTLPYDWTKKKISNNNNEDAAMRSSSHSSPGVNQSTKQASCSYEISDRSECTLSEDKANSSKEHKSPKKSDVEYSKIVAEIKKNVASFQGRLAEWRSKRKRIVNSDDSSDDVWPVKVSKRKRRVISDSSNNSDAIANENVQAIEDDTQSYHSHSSHEATDQCAMNVNRELQVALTRLEESADMNVLRWRDDRAVSSRNTSRSSSPIREAEEHLSDAVPTVVDDEETSTSSSDIRLRVTPQHRGSEADNIRERDRRRELIVPDDNEPSTSENTHQASPRSAKATEALRKRYDPERLNVAFKSCINLWKKYKLFRKPRVLLIRFETLCNPFRDGVYSVKEIEFATHKYIHSVISTSSVVHKSWYRLLDSIGSSNFDSDIASTEADNASAIVSSSETESDVDKTFSASRSPSKKSPLKGTTLLILFLLLILA